MKKKIVLFLMLFLILCAAGVTAMGQEAKSPVTKEEILRLLKQPPGQRSEQGDLAGAISERGIAFKVNDQTLTELKKAGAKSFLIDATSKTLSSIFKISEVFTLLQIQFVNSV